MSRRVSAFAAAAAVLVSAAAVSYAGRTPDRLEVEDRRPTDVATSRATLACPRPAEGKSSETTLFAVAPPAQVGAGPGELTTTPLSDGTTQTRDQVKVRGQAVERTLTDEDAPSLIVSGSGTMSGGLQAVQWTVERGKKASGTSTTWCQTGADKWWFGGVSTAVGAESDLVLTNSTPAIAVVDLRFFDADGPVEAVGERGIALAPNTQESLPLSRFAPGRDELTLNVEATTGRVTAALTTELTSGVTPAGTEWISPAVPPAESTLVDAAFGDADQQTLQVTNPGEREALVEVQVVDDSGAFTPSGLESLRVPPGTVASEDLTDVVDKSASAVLLTSNRPVTGALVSTSTRPSDVAVSAPSPWLDDPAVVPVIAKHDLEIAFSSATRKGGAVQIDGFAASGNSTVGEKVNLEGQTTTVWSPPKKDDAAYYVVSVLVDGEMQATALYSGKAGISTLPLLPGRYTVSRPDVQPAR